MADKKKKPRYIVTPTFRVSFPNIVEKSEMSGKYRLMMMFDASADITELKKMAKAARLEKWSKALPKNFQNPFKLVDNMDVDDRYDGMEDGMVVISASASYRPGVVDSKRNQVDLEEMDAHLYGGMYARAAVSAYAYDHKSGNRGVAFGLDAIQIVKDGEPLGSRVSAEEAFADVEDDDYDDDDTTEADDFDL